MDICMVCGSTNNADINILALVFSTQTYIVLLDYI